MDNNNFSAEEVDNCVAALRAGQTILYPTDTVWGIGCDATQSAAVTRIFELKQRSPQKSMIVLLADAAALEHYTAQVSDQVFDLIRQATQPTTFIFEQARNLPANVINEDGSIAIRITRDPFCQALIRGLGRPLISTSANISGAAAAALYPEIDKAIVQGVDYVVRYRQEDLQAAAPSQIIRMEADGSLTRLR